MISDLTQPNGEVKRVEVAAPRYRYIDDSGQHMHTLDGKPLIGTSTAVQVLGKEGLIWWAAELAAVVCLESGEHIPTIRKEYEAVSELSGKDKKNARDRLQRKYPIFKKARYAHKEKKETAAGPGTDMHGQLERYIKECIYEHAGYPVASEAEWDISPEVLRFHEWACGNVEQFLWSEFHCYSEELWTGGICDCLALLKDGDVTVLDFKSAKEAYWGPFIQCGGYALQVGENGVLDRDGKQLDSSIDIDAIAVFPLGGSAEAPTIRRDVPSYLDAFEAAVLLHKLQEKFNK
jgi:hypothetical protein